MNSRRSLTGIFIAVIIALILLGTLAYWVISRADKSRYEIPVLGQLPAFEFVDQDGQPFGSADLKGKVAVIDFIFTRCKGPCPVMATKFLDLYNLFQGSDRVQLVSVTVDPEYDSVSVLKEYAESQGVNDNRWLFLHTSMDSLISFSEQGLKIAADKASLPGGHSTRFVLIDPEGRIRGYYDGLDDISIAKLKNNIKRLLDESQ